MTSKTRDWATIRETIDTSSAAAMVGQARTRDEPGRYSDYRAKLGVLADQCRQRADAAMAMAEREADGLANTNQAVVSHAARQVDAYAVSAQEWKLRADAAADGKLFMNRDDDPEYARSANLLAAEAMHFGDWVTS